MKVRSNEVIFAAPVLRLSLQNFMKRIGLQRFICPKVTKSY